MIHWVLLQSAARHVRKKHNRLFLYLWFAENLALRKKLSKTSKQKENREIATFNPSIRIINKLRKMHPTNNVSCFSFHEVIMVSPNIWLFFMTKMTLENQQKPITLAIYASLASAALGLAIIRGYIFIYVCLKAAESLHNQMVSSLLQTLVLFFDTNPAGRILNRFSKDIGEIDDLLPKIFLLTTQMMLFVFTAAILPSFTNAWLVLVTIPIFLIFAYLGWYYLKTSRELKRLESICRSPVFSHFSETLTGLDTIRTRKRERDFIDKFYQ